MLFAKEIFAERTHFNVENDSFFYVRVDITNKFIVKNFLNVAHKNKTPVLFLPSIDVHPTRMDDLFVANAIKAHLDIAKEFLAAGITHLVLAADDDGVMHKLISPKFRPADIHVRAQPLLSLYRHLRALMPNFEVILTVEDLSPAGLDATDGVWIARALQECGLEKIIATAGTKDFPKLFDRRTTQKKNLEACDFASNEPALASALWLLEHTDLAVGCCAFIDNKNAAIEMAEKLNLYILLERDSCIKKV